MILHKAMTEVIDRVVVDSREIPVRVFQDFGRGGMDRHRLGQHLRQRVEAFIFRLINLVVFGNKQSEHLARDIHGDGTELG